MCRSIHNSDQTCVMQNSQFSLLVEQFIAGVIPIFREPIRIDKSFTAAEALSLPGDTIFDHDVNMEDHVLRIAGCATFHGSVSNAVILALGNVQIEGESRNCHIFALDSLCVAQAESSMLMSCGDVSFQTDVLRTSAAAAGAIIGEQASVYGGMLVAGNGINVRNACGLPDDPPMSLSCCNREVCASAAQLEAAYVNRLIRLRKFARGNQLADYTENTLAYLQNAIEKHRTVVELLHRQAGNGASTITIPGRIDSGIQLDIDGHSFTVNQDMSGVVFSVHNDDIIIDSARQAAEVEQVTYVEV